MNTKSQTKSRTLTQTLIYSLLFLLCILASNVPKIHAQTVDDSVNVTWAAVSGSCTLETNSNPLLDYGIISGNSLTITVYNDTVNSGLGFDILAATKGGGPSYEISPTSGDNSASFTISNIQSDIALNMVDNGAIPGSCGGNMNDSVLQIVPESATIVCTPVKSDKGNYWAISGSYTNTLGDTSIFKGSSFENEFPNATGTFDNNFYASSSNATFTIYDNSNTSGLLLDSVQCPGISSASETTYKSSATTNSSPPAASAGTSSSQPTGGGPNVQPSTTSKSPSNSLTLTNNSPSTNNQKSWAKTDLLISGISLLAVLVLLAVLNAIGLLVKPKKIWAKKFAKRFKYSKKKKNRAKFKK